MTISCSSSATGCSMAPEAGGGGDRGAVSPSPRSILSPWSAIVRPSAATVAGLLLLTAAPGVASAQQAETVDSGRFEIRTGGTAVATETFAIRRESSAIQSVARRSPVPELAGSMATVEFRMQTNPRFEPGFFELRLRDGELETVVGVRSGTRIKITERTPEGERWREFRLSPGLVVLPEGLAHTYYFVLETLDRTSAAELPVLHPLQGEGGSVTVDSRRPETIQVAGETLQAVRVSLRLAGEAHEVWIDDRGRILRVVIPDREWSAERLPDRVGSPEMDL